MVKAPPPSGCLNDPMNAPSPRGPQRGRLPPLVVYILKSAGLGSAIGAALAVLLVVTDTGGLRTLIGDTGDQVTPVILLAAGFAISMGGLSAAVAIMRLPSDD